jgi:dienelactone hydrolase
MKKVKTQSLLFTIALFQFGFLFSQPKLPNAQVDQKKPEEENLSVFHDWLRWSNPGAMRSNHLLRLAEQYYESRANEIAKLNSASDWKMRQEKVKATLNEIIGPFPERTPLNAKITGTIKREGYRIEKIVFESFPNFYVTACLYIPDEVKGQIPAVLNVIGHEQESFRAPLDQVINQNLVKKGMVVLTIDPLGQGEHVQYFDEKVNFSSIGYSVIEHCYFGNQVFLSGSSAAKYFIWDGIRAIDYLVSRKEVDPERIGVTGFSGGGTVTAYLAAFDPRVKVSVPSSWSTASKRQLETKGTQDAESVMPSSLKNGITFKDLLEVRAPKPTLLTFTSRDEYLSMQGARDAFQESKKAYDALGFGDHLELVEDDSKHWLTPRIRTAIYSFFIKHFSLTSSPVEVEAEIMSVKELTVTPTGQSSTSYKGDLVFDVNRKEAAKAIAALEQSRQKIQSHLAQVKANAMERSGYVAPCGKYEAMINGRFQRDGYTVAKLAMPGEGDYAIPLLLFVPDNKVEKHRAIIYLHPSGKIAEAKPGGEIEALVKQGYIVAAADVLGVGETTNKATRTLTDAYTAVLIGRSLVGIQAGDIVRVANYLKTRSDVDQAKLGAVAKDELCIPLLHAAAFDNSIQGLILIGSPLSYRSIATNRNYKYGLKVHPGGGTHHPYELDFDWGVAGVLKSYDLPDLMALVAPRKIAMVDPKDHLRENASAEFIQQELSFAFESFGLTGQREKLRIISAGEPLTATLDWCFK